jgi:hypothetical protein
VTFEQADTNNSGCVDKPEWEAMQIEFERERLIDENNRRDSQRKMAWFGLGGMLVYPSGVVLSSLMGLDKAADLLADMSGVYYASTAALVGAYFGATNLSAHFGTKPSAPPKKP